MSFRAVFIVLLISGIQAEAGEYRTIDPAGSIATYITAISGDTVVGRYFDGNPIGTTGQHCFLYQISTGNYTILPKIGSFNLMPTAISGNNVVGWYPGPLTQGGMVWNTQTKTYTQIPHAGKPTAISGNKVVGSTGFSTGTCTSYLYDVSTNTIEKIYNSSPTVNGIDLHGISDNTIIGDRYPVGPSGPAKGGFVANASMSDIHYFDNGTTPTAISGNKVVGLSYEESGNTFQSYGFVYDTLTDEYTSLPMFTSTLAISGNNIVGDGISPLGYHSFLYDDSTGIYSIIAPENAVKTWSRGVSGNNMVGEYNDINGQSHGFLYTVPEPSTLVLFAGLSVMGVTVWGMRKFITTTPN
jgi:hypothetical protein